MRKYIERMEGHSVNLKVPQLQSTGGVVCATSVSTVLQSGQGNKDVGVRATSFSERMGGGSYCDGMLQYRLNVQPVIRS